MNQGHSLIADLEILVRRGPGELAYEVTAADYGLRLNHKPMGSIPLNREPRSYFNEFFETVSKADCLASALAKRDVEEDALRKMGLRFFEELFPVEMQDLLWSLRKKVGSLLILSEEPWIPWELCRLEGRQDDSIREGSFFCEAFDMTRWLLGRGHCTAFSMEKLALPGGASSRLPGAERERRELVTLFQRHGQVDRIPGRLAELNAAMAAGVYDAWHFSGHGAQHEKNPFVCLELADGTLLTPDTIAGANRNLGRNHPFVFMNCCHSGRAGFSLTGVSGWAHKLLGNGVGAFAGTQWAIDDESARQFSLAFYRHFFDGCRLGEAVRKARAEIRREGEATWLAFTVFGHPLARYQPRSHGRARVAVDRPAAFDITRYISAKTRHFSGRQWLFAAVADFARKNPCGYFVLQGAAGLGKTSFLAALALRTGGAIAFFNNRLAGVSGETAFWDYLRVAGRNRFAIDCGEAADARSRLLEALAQKGPVFILVDALDDAEPVAAGNPLGLPASVPEGVYFVLTSREEPNPFERQSPWEVVTLDARDVRHRDDLRQFSAAAVAGDKVTSFLASRQLSPAHLLELLEDRCQGSFLYAASYLEEIETGKVTIDPSELPVGLTAFFQARWEARKRLAGADWAVCELPLLAILAVLREAVPVALLAAFAGLPESRVLPVLERWTPLLYMEPGATPAGPCRYRIDHPTFREFLIAMDERGAELDLAAASEKIVRVLHRQFAGPVQRRD